MKTASSIFSLRKCLYHLAGYFLFAVIILLITPLFGSESISLRQILSGENGIDSQILFQLRIPRILFGFIVGGTLAIVGAVFQIVLRNPLAEPYTLGITGGAATGAALALSYPALVVTFAGLSSLQLFSLVGSALCLGVIYIVAKRAGQLSMGTLLLAGVTLGILCSALTLLVRYISNPDLLVSMDRWIMGSLDIAGFAGIWRLLPLLLPGLGLLLMQVNSLNHLALGEEMAMGHGVDVSSVQRTSFIAGSMVTAAVVSIAGPIGFVGLLVPHAVRRLSGFDHKLVLPACFLLGGSFLVLCDSIARTIVAPTEMPVGIITALAGGPFFIYLLIRKQK